VLIFSIGLCSVSSVCLRAEIPGDSGTYRTRVDSSNLFSSDEPLEITLKLDLNAFLKTKKEPQPVDGLCTIGMADDTAVRSIKIKARGEMRRAYCHFPPIMLKFGQKADDNFPLNGSLKLVVPCYPTAKYETYVLKEYLVYKLFNEVTPYSLKTRLVKVNLIDNVKTNKSYTAYGFVIESEKKMAERNHAIFIKNPNLTQHHMNPEDIARIALFNYMIGNTDWSVPMQHNIRILVPEKAGSEKAIPVAYDFDYAGFVNPPYAIPAKELPITEVRERYYMGMCANSEALEAIIE